MSQYQPQDPYGPSGAPGPYGGSQGPYQPYGGQQGHPGPYGSPPGGPSPYPGPPGSYQPPPGGQGPYPNPYGAPPPKKRRVWLWVLLGVLGLAFLLIAGCSVLLVGAVNEVAKSAATASPRPSATSRATPTPHPSGRPTPAKTGSKISGTIGEGTYEVGVDVQAGSYRTTVPSDSIACYWSRSTDASGRFASVLSNDVLSSGANGTVTIAEGEYFKSEGCGTWTRQ